MDEFGPDQESRFDERPTPDTSGPNVLGIIGFILSLTCVLSPVGLLMSLFALTKPKKGFAIAGVIIGAILSVIVIVGTYFAINEFSKPEFKARFETESDFRAIQGAINASGSTPTTLDDPSLNFNQDMKTDYWGTPYEYAEDGAGNWTLTTYGPDAQKGGGDDATLQGDAGVFDSAQALDAVYQVWKERMRDTPDNVQGGSPDPAPAEEGDGTDDAPADPPADPSDS